MKEQWKRIPGFPDYKVSCHGFIISTKHNRIKRIGFYDCHGYQKVQISRKGIVQRIAVHRVVAKCFLSNPDNKPVVNHIDGNKQNNRVSNLEWATHLENSTHAWETGLATTNTDAHKGEDHANAKLTEISVKNIRRMARNGRNFIDLSHVYRVSQTQIKSIVERKSWKHVK